MEQMVVPGVVETPGQKPASRVKTLALVGGLVAIVGGTAVAGGGWLAFSRLNGGGPQPESVLPADTVAFLKVDMNPSGSQKVAAVRFALRFPEAKGKVTESSDLRKVAFEKLQEDGEFKDLDYATDVAPWLGERFAVGVLPGAGAKEEPITVIVLAVTDEDKARASLPQLTGKSDTACGVRDGFAICSEDKTTVTVLTEAEQSTSLAPRQFASDMEALGEDGVAAAWVDLKKVGDEASETRGALGLPGLPLGDVPQGGRLAVALRFAGPHLELAGRVTDMPLAWPAERGGGNGVADLPSGTLAAFGLDSAGEQVTSSLLSSKDFAEDLESAERDLGVSLPEDLTAALGDRATLAYGGMEGGTVNVALRTAGDPAAVGRFVTGMNGDTMGTFRLHQGSADGDPVVATTEGYAGQVASGSGLGEQQSFRDAVPGAKDARAVLYLDIASLLKEHGDVVGAELRENLQPFSALGVSTRGQDKAAEFTVRLTTR
ncbi:DUF3352 domain-containing protein [Knoellia sp. 3-2P3]|uniref:DUF3352 domain-containing protein n=1 Tax=unclassified Knoellia TaxID=2618719 RepID=UPI0023DAC06F|nr:DUF3352 domain-containing protein [Knoellia sp. 3-2P3]MDF2091359.1 DUF3352 domain-containing protein [Knoellia sp. 3-2P3]